MTPDFAIVSPTQDALMKRLVGEVHDHLERVRPNAGARVLLLPSYYMIPYTRLRDFVMALALIARGVEVIPVEFGTFHPEECILYGGLFGKNRTVDLREECRIESALLRELLALNPISLSVFRTKEDREISHAYSSAVSLDNYRTVVRDGYPVGEKAAHATMNLNNLGQVKGDAEFLRQLRIHVYNIVELQLAFQRVFDKVQPSSVISNIPYYYRWGVPFSIARERKIPFYSLGVADKKNSVAFQRNTDVLFDFSDGWPDIKDRPLTVDEERLSEHSIKLRFDANVTHFQNQLGFARAGTASPERDALVARLKAHGGRVAFFPTNILCDAPVYQPCPAFPSLPDMLVKVLQYFTAHPEYQLIIKAHPGEKTFDQEHLRDVAAESKANTLVAWLASCGVPIPPNVVVVDAYTKISALDIIPLVHVGMCYSSSVALEMALLGWPMISTANAHYQGKGFMLYPDSQAEFFAMLAERLQTDEADAIRGERRELARRYNLLNYGYASIDWGVLQGSDTHSVEDKLLLENSALLLPGNNRALDYMCDCIVHRLPVVGPGRLPPLTGPGLPVGG